LRRFCLLNEDFSSLCAVYQVVLRKEAERRAAASSEQTEDSFGDLVKQQIRAKLDEQAKLQAQTGSGGSK